VDLLRSWLIRNRQSNRFTPPLKRP
jgi:hypothetical protein